MNLHVVLGVMPCDGKNGKRPRVELLINNGVEAKLFLMRKIIPQGVIFFIYWLTYVLHMLILSMEKIILTDVDGVLLNWEYAFVTWMEEHGYKMIENGNFIYNIKKRFNLESNNKGHKLIRQFNESATIGYLPALRDSQHYVKLLGNLGYKFHVITSLSKNPLIDLIDFRETRQILFAWAVSASLPSFPLLDILCSAPL